MAASSIGLLAVPWFCRWRLNMQMENHEQPWPYSGGWPTWPFTRLSEHDMAQMLGRLEQPRRSLAEELEDDVGEALL